MLKFRIHVDSVGAILMLKIFSKIICLIRGCDIEESEEYFGILLKCKRCNQKTSVVLLEKINFKLPIKE